MTTPPNITASELDRMEELLRIRREADEAMRVADPRGDHARRANNAEYEIANAAPALISAARRAEKMRAALERTLSWLTSYPGGGAMGAYEQARAALAEPPPAKGTGEAP